MTEQKQQKQQKIAESAAEDTREGHRVQKLLSNYGHCSRRKAEELIAAGRVEVNGKKIILGDKATETDTISVDGKIVGQEKKVYLMFNKPIYCVTALTDKQYRTVMYYIKIKERVFPIGRLDYNTSGLLLLTNDGDFANSIMHPRYEIKKTYLVNTVENISGQVVKQIEKGVMLDDGMTSPAKVKQISKTSMEITIHEGKNRIIRRILEALGYHTKSLERIRVGNLGLGTLKQTQYKFLTEDEKKKIFQ